MGKIHVVTMPKLNRALDRVTTELARHGLWDEALGDVDVYLAFFDTAYGYQAYGEGGEIVIPRFSLPRLRDWWSDEYTSLTDVLRHEYGHALADTHRGLLRSSRFVDAFGAPHSSDIEWEYDGEFHVTGYAATDPSEDFAETFMLYLKHDGRLPGCLTTPAIRAKWRFVRSLCGAVRRGWRRWT